MGICCGSSEKAKILSEIKSDINNEYIVVYSKVGCPKSLKVKSLLHSIHADPKIIEINSLIAKSVLKEFTLQKSLPFVFIGGSFIETRKFEAEIKKGGIQSMVQSHVQEKCA